MSDAAQRSASSLRSQFDRPIFIVSAPRSGSTLLFQTFLNAPDVYTIGGESHMLIEAVPGLHPRFQDWHSNRLTAAHAGEAIAKELARRFYAALRDRDGHPPAGQVRMLEKTPKNSLRIPFITSVFPDARFVFLYRDPRQTMSSMMEAWSSGGFRTYPRLPDWPAAMPWSLLLVPGWQELRDLPLPQIVAEQWTRTMLPLLHDLQALPEDRVTALSYADFLAAPQATLKALASKLDLGWDRQLPEQLPLSATTVSRPDPEKWRRNAAALEAVWPIVSDADKQAQAVMERYRLT